MIQIFCLGLVGLSDNALEIFERFACLLQHFADLKFLILNTVSVREYTWQVFSNKLNIIFERLAMFENKSSVTEIPQPECYVLSPDTSCVSLSIGGFGEHEGKACQKHFC